MIAATAADTETLALQEAQDGLRGVIGRLETAEAGMDIERRFSDLTPIKLALESQMRALALMGETL